MSRIVWPGIAATAVALFLITRKRKSENEFELELVPEADSAEEMPSADAALAAE
jgi:hypothetical protein